MSIPQIRPIWVVAEDLAKRFDKLNISYVSIRIGDIINKIDKRADLAVELTDREKVYDGELATRLISTLVLEYADRTKHCAVNSTNGTEIVLGEFCIGAGGDYAPLADFYKSSVYCLAEHLDIPNKIINRKPINSTFGNDKTSSYFNEVPDNLMPKEVYNVLDPILFGLFYKGYKP